MALCRQAHPLSFGVPLHLCRADHGVHSGWDLGADRGCSLLVQVSQALLVPASPSLSLCLGELVPMLPGRLGGFGGEAIAALASPPAGMASACWGWRTAVGHPCARRRLLGAGGT